MPQPTPATVFLFTDIEGSTRLWEQSPERMREALARHDAIAAASVEASDGRVVKTTGDGVHAVFHDPLDALKAAIAIQVALDAVDDENAIRLRVRAGLHVGAENERGNDFYGTSVNRAARIMTAAHGGQILVSDAVASLVRDRLPSETSLRPLGRVRLRDLDEPEAVHQVVHASLRAEFPALRSLESTPNNLPHALTSFIGREKELEETKHLLAQTRLLTLVGIGGLGKSRLSLQLARDVMGDYIDGVWLVELASITDPRVVPHAVATVLGVKEDAGSGIVFALRRFVADRHLLLILDNCEHLAGACAEIARELLEAGANARILASSRERLNIRGEKIYSLAPLTTPVARADLTHEALIAFSAARLFVERVCAVKPGFVVTSENAVAVADVCRRLDGIPLALELAAARMSAMSLSTIASRLDDRFRLLQRGDRTALPRQQTLRALIDWSYELLDERERASFARLSVFAGGFTLEAAEAVLTCARIAREDVSDVVADLTEKSLVTLDAERERYHMLDTVREYAEHILAASAECKTTRHRHLEYYAAWVESIRSALTGPEQGVWLSRLDLELENILAAHRWCDDAPAAAALGLQLVSSMKLYWITRGAFGLGLRLTMEALSREPTPTDDLARCRGLFQAGQLALYVGHYDDAGGYLRESLALARRLQNPAAIQAVLPPLATASIRNGDLQQARRYLSESVALARDLANKRQLAAALSELAQLDRLEGNLESSRKTYAEVLQLARDLDDRESIAVGLLNFGMWALAVDDARLAGDLLREVAVIARETGSKTTIQGLLDAVVALESSRSNWQRAAYLHGAVEALTEETAFHRHPADEAFMAPFLARIRENLGDVPLREESARGRALSLEASIDEAVASLDANARENGSTR